MHCGDIGCESFAFALECRTGREIEKLRWKEAKSRQIEANAGNEHDRASVSAHTPPQVRAITKDRVMQGGEKKRNKKRPKEDALFSLSIKWYTLSVVTSHC